MQGKGLEAKAETAVSVGIDVSKTWLDIYLHPIGHVFRVSNRKEDLHELARKLAGLKKIDLVVPEATGKLHRSGRSPLECRLQGLPSTSPRRWKEAESRRVRGKSDADNSIIRWPTQDCLLSLPVAGNIFFPCRYQ